MAIQMTVADIQHPLYRDRFRDWRLWRDVYAGGQIFIDRYLQKFSSRESADDYARRKSMTYNPAFAKEAVNEIKNSIFQRLEDIVRAGGSESYTQSVEGMNGGVDLLGSSMNSFIGRKLLPELLTMARVGVYVDMPQISGVTVADVRGARPYVYLYQTEDIRSWCYDETSSTIEFTNVLLRDYYNTYDDQTGLPNGTGTRFRRMWIEDGVVHLQFYDATGMETTQDGNRSNDSTITLDIPRIPFIIVELSDSLLAEVARYQVGLLNLASSDMAYALSSNFPFYTEMFEPRAMNEFTRKPGNSQGGEQSDAQEGKQPEVRVGVTRGRRYPKGMDRPGFIHPSPEPLKASMEKQEQMKNEIRQLVNLAVTNLSPKMASAESKGMDRQGLESGLSYIGLELENMERQIAVYWAMYENGKPATVNYPTNYSIKTEEERRKEADDLTKLIPIVPSRTFQKEICKQIADLTIGQKVDTATLKKIETEIDNSQAMTVQPEVITQCVEVGICDLKLAADLMGFPDGTTEKAAKDHADRLARIAETQTANNGLVNGAARGNPDTAANLNGGSQEKKAAKDTTQDPVVKDKQRGEGK